MQICEKLTVSSENLTDVLVATKKYDATMITGGYVGDSLHIYANTDHGEALVDIGFGTITHKKRFGSSLEIAFKVDGAPHSIRIDGLDSSDCDNVMQRIKAYQQ